jgi:hypothetical protein
MPDVPRTDLRRPQAAEAANAVRRQCGEAKRLKGRADD